MPSPLPFESDPTMVAAFDAASFWLLSAAFQACMGGVSLSTYLGSLLPRLHTGYANEATRRAVRHRRHCDGLHFNRGAVAA